MAGIYAYNTRYGLILRWSGQAEDDAVIEDSNLGLNTNIPGSLLSSKMNRWAVGTKFIGYGNKDAYEGKYILITSRSSSEYSFRLIEPGVGHYANGGLRKDVNPYYAGFEKAVQADLNGDGVIEGCAGFYISNATVEEGGSGSFIISRGRFKGVFQTLGSNDITFPVTLNVKSSTDDESHQYTHSSPAQPGVDYIPVDTSVTFQPGELEKKINFSTIEDNLKEESEKFRIEVTTADDDIVWQKHINAEVP